MKIKYNSDGLIPAVIQDVVTKDVLMLGYMNQEAFDQTMSTKKVTFYSRSKGRLWVKGETSGNFLNLVSVKNDCDNDALLVSVNPVGVVCHTGSQTCWGEPKRGTVGCLEEIIADRKTKPKEGSYVSSLFEKGINKVAQKVGEEAVEVVIEAKDNNDELFLNESADLFFHYLILLQAKGFLFEDILKQLDKRRA